MAEGILLSVIGAVLGLAIAHWGLKALLAANPQSIPRAAEIGLDPLVLVFTVGIALITGLVFGLAPLLHVSEHAVAAAIKEGGARSTTTGARNRVRRGLVVAEIALAVMLVIGAGSGSDVAIALSEGAQHVDAVDIDPRILQIWVEGNPDRAYQDSRVTRHVNDGRAFLEGRGYVTPEDFKAVGFDVLRHRLGLSYEAEAEEISAEALLKRIFDSLRVL